MLDIYLGVVESYRYFLVNMRFPMKNIFPLDLKLKPGALK